MDKRALAVIPAAVALALGSSGAAYAAPVADISMGQADILSIAGNVRVSGDTATVSFVYKCTGEAPAVWASVKQLADPTARADWDFDTHGTSGQSAAWYDTHTSAPCEDGKATRMTVTMNRADFGPGASWKQLKKGVGYVQLCLTRGGDPESGQVGPDDAFAAFNDWVPVQR